MGLARFFAKDPYTPEAVKEELEDLIPKIRGVLHWSIHPNGFVTLEYDCRVICAELIEEAIAGVGFEVKHIFDKPDTDEDKLQETLGYQIVHPPKLAHPQRQRVLNGITLE